jgi:hypothetical protein
MIFALGQMLHYVENNCISAPSNANYTPLKYKLRLCESVLFVGEKLQFVDANFAFDSANNEFKKVHFRIWTYG